MRDKLIATIYYALIALGVLFALSLLTQVPA